jgi:hypothetical protein
MEYIGPRNDKVTVRRTFVLFDISEYRFGLGPLSEAKARVERKYIDFFNPTYLAR